MNWRAEFSKVFNVGPLSVGAPNWICELAVRYHRLAQSNGLRTPKEGKMYALAKALDVEGVKAISDVWKYMIVRDHEDARAAKRKAPSEPKPEVQKSRRPTARQTVLELLRERPVRSDDQIIAAVNARTFHDGFNQLQLNWYRNQYKQGKLKGQTGPEVVDEGPGQVAKTAFPSPKTRDLTRSAHAVARAAS